MEQSWVGSVYPNNYSPFEREESGDEKHFQNPTSADLQYRNRTMVKEINNKGNKKQITVRSSSFKVQDFATLTLDYFSMH